MKVNILAVQGSPRTGYRARVAVYRRRFFFFGPLVVVAVAWVDCPQPQRRLTPWQNED